MIQSPFTVEQVESLNGYQKAGPFHPFTCGTDSCRHDLIATEEGWVCPECDYTQCWAHDFMANNSWQADFSFPGNEHIKQMFSENPLKTREKD